MLPRLHRLTLLSFLSVALGFPCFAQNCPLTPSPTISSPQPPTDVCIPDGFGGLPIDYFDDYSWRTFVALVWPVASGQRGVPDKTKTVGAIGPRVFDTYKALWEVFHPDGSAPSSVSFNDYEVSTLNACKMSSSHPFPNSATSDRRVLAAWWGPWPTNTEIMSAT